MPIFGREDFWGEKTPLKIAILGGRIFGRGGGPLAHFSPFTKLISIKVLESFGSILESAFWTPSPKKCALPYISHMSKLLTKN